MFDPPAWSLAVGDTGKYLILISAALFAVSGASWFFSNKSAALEKAAKPSFTLACAALIGAFVSLGILFAFNRFEFEYVYGHSDHANALAFRIAGIWSGQEGSFLLWGACSAIFALFTVPKTGHYRRWYTIAYAFFLGGIASIIAFESPFNLNMLEGRVFVPEDGVGLAPALQNYWVTIHPPVIFIGFGSLTSLFAMAVSALVLKDYEGWIPIVRPWATIATVALGLGLCMGGFWAYETLGWGGFWMWDPVENVSFVPWCFGAALMHGILVQVTKKKWQMSNLLMAGLPFFAFLYGTYLTRSGKLSEVSVHSFAEMDSSALKLLLVLMGGAFIGFMVLWCWRVFENRKKAGEAAPEAGAFSREGFYLVGITLLIVMGAATGIGMSVPFIQAILGQQAKTVEEGVYHQVLVWIFVPTMIIMAATPFVTWKGLTFKDLFYRIYTTLCITVGLTGLMLFLAVITPFRSSIEIGPDINFMGRPIEGMAGLAWVTFLVFLCLFVTIANIVCAMDIVKRSRMGTLSFLTHIGVGVLMLGLVASRGFELKGNDLVMEGGAGRMLHYEVRYAGMTLNDRDRDNQVKLEVFNAHKPGKPVFVAYPGYYKKTMADGRDSVMVWPHIHRGLLMDTYVSMGTPQENASQEFSLKPGESTKFDQFDITYKRMTRKGQPGTAGTRFGAEVDVKVGDMKMPVNPELEIGGPEGTKEHPAKIAEDIELVMSSMNVADNSVTFRVQLTKPIFPVEIYHKPLTSLVWLGTGIMTVAGLGSAYYRRPRRLAAKSQDPEKGDKAV